MKLIALDKFGDSGTFTDSIWVGENDLPEISNGTLEEDVIKVLERCGYKKVEPKTLLFTDDFLCNHPEEKKRKDHRHRLTTW